MHCAISRDIPKVQKNKHWVKRVLLISRLHGFNPKKDCLRMLSLKVKLKYPS